MEQIEWPHSYHPKNRHVHVSNEIEIAASPEAVWECLIRARDWPEWYANSGNVALGASDRHSLAPGLEFTWKTFGVALRSKVIEFVPNERLAWDARATGIDAYHAWLLEPLPTGHTRVLTEETQNGFLARAGSLFMPKRMWKFHQLWLEGLKKRVEAGSRAKAAGV